MVRSSPGFHSILLQLLSPNSPCLGANHPMHHRHLLHSVAISRAMLMTSRLGALEPSGEGCFCHFNPFTEQQLAAIFHENNSHVTFFAAIEKACMHVFVPFEKRQATAKNTAQQLLNSAVKIQKPVRS